MQLEEIKDVVTILSRGIYECKDKNCKDIIGIISYIALSNRLLDIVIDKGICATFFGLIIKLQASLDVEGHINALNGILNIYKNPSGKSQILANEAIIDYIRKSLTKEDPRIGSAAADICIRFLKDSMFVLSLDVDNQILRKLLPYIGMYSTLDNEQANEKYAEIIKGLKKKRKCKDKE